MTQKSRAARAAAAAAVAILVLGVAPSAAQVVSGGDGRPPARSGRLVSSKAVHTAPINPAALGSARREPARQLTREQALSLFRAASAAPAAGAARADSAAASYAPESGRPVPLAQVR